MTTTIDQPATIPVPRYYVPFPGVSELIVTVATSPFPADITIVFDGYQYDYDTGLPVHEWWIVTRGDALDYWRAGERYAREIVR